MDSSSVARSKVTMQRGGVAGGSHKRRLKEYKNEGEETDHRSNDKTKRRSVADLSGGSDSELIGNSARNQRLKKQKTKAIDHVRGVSIICFNFCYYTYSVPNFQSNSREFTLQEKEDDRGKGLMDVYQVKKAKNGARDIKHLVSTAP